MGLSPEPAVSALAAPSTVPSAGSALEKPDAVNSKTAEKRAGEYMVTKDDD